MHGFRAVISTTPQWASALNSRSVTLLLRWRLLLALLLLLSCFLSERTERWPLPLGIGPGASNGGFGMEGQLRPGLRADDEEAEVVMVVVLELTVVLEEDVEEDEVVAGADGACTSLADESTLR